MSDEQAAPETKGVTVKLLATVDLGPEIEGMAGRQLRMRLVTIACQRLFRYISGNNGAQQKIAMTAPVTQSRGEKIAMTAPVSQVADGRAVLVAFTLPSTYRSSLRPGRWTPPSRFASCRRSSWPAGATPGAGPQATTVTTKRCCASVSGGGLTRGGEPVLARYNTPFTPWFMRRNEVLIPVARQPVR